MATTYQPLPEEQLTNPTQVTQNNPTFGKSDQFNIDPFIQPFPFEQQKTENQNFNQQFSSFLGGLETPEATRDRLANRYGYDNLAEDYFRTGEAARGVMDQARALPENIQQRANNSGQVMNQAQLDRIQNTEVKDLMETYSSLASINEEQGKRLAYIEQNMNQAAQLEMARAQREMTPWLMAYDDKQIMQAREFSGWSTASQFELNRLLANQQAGLSWTDAEANRAHQLAMQESLFSHQLNMLEKQNEYALDLWSF